MKSILLIILISTFSAVAGFSQPLSKDSTAIKEIVALEYKMANAIGAGDKKSYDQVTHQQYRETFNEIINTKSSILKEMNPMPGISFEYPNLEVEVYGNAALVRGIGLWFFDSTRNEKNYVRFTDMLVKENNSWKMVSSHVNNVPGWTVSRLSDEQLVDSAIIVDCDNEGKMQSGNSEQPAFLRFKNLTNDTVVIYWINYEGKRAMKRPIEPGKSIDQKTYITHPFIVQGRTDKCYGIYMARKKPSLVLIK